MVNSTGAVCLEAILLHNLTTSPTAHQQLRLADYFGQLGLIDLRVIKGQQSCLTIHVTRSDCFQILQTGPGTRRASKLSHLHVHLFEFVAV